MRTQFLRAAAMCSAAMLLSACDSGSSSSGSAQTPKWTVTASTGAGGSAAPASQQITQGQAATITLTPATGFEVTGATGCGGTLDGNTYTIAAVSTDCAVNATFALRNWTITPSASAGGTLNPATPQQIQHGSGTSFTVTPDSGFELATVTGCDGTLNGNTYTIPAASASCTVAANFTPKQWTVTANAGPNGSAAPLSQVVNNGQNASITFTPNTGYVLDSVNGCAGSLAGNVFTASAVTANCTATASFTALHTVTATAGTGGSISPASQDVVDNETAVVTLTADPGYFLDSITGCGVALDTGDWTTAAVTANCTISATFRTTSSLFAGRWHTCSLLDATGLVVNKCWGQNNVGQLGSSAMTLTAQGDQPGEVPRLLPAIDLDPSLSIWTMALGNFHSCAVLSDSQTYCWGGNGNGALGIGAGADTNAMSAPVDLGDIPVADVSGGGDFSCARLVDGSVRCWGENSSGQLGDGSATATSLPSTPVPLADRALQVRTGWAHTCARLADNTVWCWGDNSSGQLGDGDGGNDSTTPALVNLAGAVVTDLAAGGLSTCVIANSQVRCWGENGSGQLGNNDNTNTDLDVASTALNIGGELPAKLAAGGEHACVLTTIGSVWCWGESDAGQTGQNDTTDDISPALVQLGAYTATSIATGGDHTCVVLRPTDPLDTTRPIRCWGEGGVGQLGLGSTDDIGDNESVDNPALNIDI